MVTNVGYFFAAVIMASMSGPGVAQYQPQLQQPQPQQPEQREPVLRYDRLSGQPVWQYPARTRAECVPNGVQTSWGAGQAEIYCTRIGYKE
jgi:hypothetical protein